MNTHPRMASRVNVLERRQNTLEALIEELSEDTTANFKQIDMCFNLVDAHIGELSRDMAVSFKQLVEYHTQTENQIDTRFDKVEKDVAEIKATMTTKEDLAGMATKEDLKTEIAAVKNDMAAMENRILDAFKQLIATIKP